MAADLRARDTPCHTSSHGFTVIELVVSLAIFAALIALLPGALGLGENIWRMSEKINKQQALGALVDNIRQKLSAAEPISEQDSVKQSRLIFLGEKSRVVFLAVADGGSQRSGPYLFEISTEHDDDSSSVKMVFTQAPYSSGVTLNDVGQLPLARRTSVRVAGLNLRYFGDKTGQGKSSWYSEWSGATQLPELVELTVAPWSTGSDFISETVALKLQR
jgi:prepilin-type N-terminal cleavage/methylation domain-containing protein